MEFLLSIMFILDSIRMKLLRRTRCKDSISMASTLFLLF
jgi:hypothetical protein